MIPRPDKLKEKKVAGVDGFGVQPNDANTVIYDTDVFVSLNAEKKRK